MQILMRLCSKNLCKKLYRTLSEPRFLTGALVTAYAVLALLGVSLLIEYSSRWAFRISFGTLILGSLIALLSAGIGGREWESVGVWLLVGASVEIGRAHVGTPVT